MRRLHHTKKTDKDPGEWIPATKLIPPLRTAVTIRLQVVKEKNKDGKKPAKGDDDGSKTGQGKSPSPKSPAKTKP